MSAAEPLLEVDDLRVWFPIKSGLVFDRHVGDVRAVDGVSFSIGRGETLGLVGESGCGKTTVGRAVLRLNKPTGGRIVFQGKDITELGEGDLRPLRRQMQMVFQDPFASLNPRHSVGRIVGEPLRVHEGMGGKAQTAAVRSLLRRVGLPEDAASRYPHEFSGGQRQRIGIARALAVTPDFIVRTSPCRRSTCPSRPRSSTCSTRSRTTSTSHTSSSRTTSPSSATCPTGSRSCTSERLWKSRPRTSCIPHPLHPYTISLLSAVPIPDPEVEQKRERILLAGDLPSPANPPPACRFHTRCPYVQETRCRDDEPLPRELQPGHFVACHWVEQIRSGEIRPKEVEPELVEQPAPKVADMPSSQG